MQPGTHAYLFEARGSDGAGGARLVAWRYPADPASGALAVAADELTQLAGGRAIAGAVDLFGAPVPLANGQLRIGREPVFVTFPARPQ